MLLNLIGHAMIFNLFYIPAMWPWEADYWEQIPSVGVSSRADEGSMIIK